MRGKHRSLIRPLHYPQMRLPPPELLSPAELHALLVTLLAGATGKPEARWRDRVGPIVKRPMTEDPRCNWTVEVSGTKADQIAISKAVEVVREAHRWVI